MKIKNTNLRNFLTGGIGYTLGAVVGVLFIYLASKLGLARGLFSLIDQNQSLLQLLGVLLIVGLLLALGGAVIGGLGGWSLARIMNTTHRSRLMVSSGVAFAISTSLLVLIFILLIGFIGLYNNFSTARIERFGILFGLFGLLFGLLTGILQALMSVRLRHSWRVFLSTTLGFAAGGIFLGILIRFLNPTEGFKTYPILTGLILLIGLLSPFFLGGGILGWSHGRLAIRAERENDPALYIFPHRWQTIIVAVLGLALAFSLIRSLDTITTFLTINAGNLQTQLIPVTVGCSGLQHSPTLEIWMRSRFPLPIKKRWVLREPIKLNTRPGVAPMAISITKRETKILKRSIFLAVPVSLRWRWI
jgi:MFS family permease